MKLRLILVASLLLAANLLKDSPAPPNLTSPIDRTANIGLDVLPGNTVELPNHAVLILTDPVERDTPNTPTLSATATNYTANDLAFTGAPEPTGFLLFGGGLALLVLYRKRHDVF
jgi:hypothetical protein